MYFHLNLGVMTFHAGQVNRKAKHSVQASATDEMTFKQLRLNQTVQGGFEKMVTMEGIVACHDTMVDLDCQGLVWKGGVSMQ